MLALGITIGVAVGFIFAVLILKVKSVGKLRVDRSDPSDNPYLFLELSRGVNQISGRKYVILEVKNENFISQN